MKITLQILTFILISGITNAQKILSGEYDPALKLAYDDKTNRLTGYFKMTSGSDFKTSPPAFSCIFYIDGTIEGDKFDVATYSPEFKSTEVIEGSMEIINDTTVQIQLPSEHGGCWNLQHFTEKPVLFELEKQIPWIQIRYVTAEKAYFHSEKSDDKRLKSYIVKNDIVCVDRQDGDWVYCTYYGKKATLGWIKISDLNQL